MTEPTPTRTRKQTNLRRKTYVVIFEADSPGGKLFDIALLVAILGSVTAVILESVPSIAAEYGTLLFSIEWVFTICFTLEYLLRMYAVDRPGRYAWSFFGIVDVLAILPTYISLLLPGAQYMTVVRILRLLRVFRVLKLTRFLGEAHVLQAALRASLPKITVFVGTVLTLVVIIGAAMQLVEGHIQENLQSIPDGMYWAIVTLTTVGYGDVAPITPLGKFMAAALMILGYGVIAVPTGIVTAEMVGLTHDKPSESTHSCRSCLSVDHRHDAIFCRRCGDRLEHTQGDVPPPPSPSPPPQ